LPKENVINPFSDLLPHADTGRCVHGFTAAPEDNQQSSPLQVVIALDVNPTRARCFALESALESALETGILDHLAHETLRLTRGHLVLRSQSCGLPMPNPGIAIDTITKVNLQHPERSISPFICMRRWILLSRCSNLKQKPQFRDLLFHHAKPVSARLCYRSGKGRAI